MKSRSVFKIIIYSLLLLGTNVVSALGNGNGAVEIEHVGEFGSYGSLVFFYTTNHTNAPACNTYRGRWVIDLSTNAGKAKYSFLLAAQVAGKEIVVEGSGTCGIISGTETAVWVGFPVNHP